MDLTTITTISSTDSKIKTAEAPADAKIIKQSIPEQPKNIPIDEKFNDDITIAKDQTVQATVIKKQDNNYTLELTNGKKIEVKLPADLKTLDKVFLTIEKSQITNIQVKDSVQTVNLNIADLKNLTQTMVRDKLLANLVDNKLPVSLANLLKPEQPIKANVLNSLDLGLVLSKEETKTLKEVSIQTAQIDLNTLKLTTNKIDLPIDKIEFKDSSLKLLLQSIDKTLGSKKVTELDLKVINQTNPKTIETSLNKDLKLELNLAKTEIITHKFITLKAEPTNSSINISKPDTSNQITSIKVTADTLKQIIEPLKQQITQFVKQEVPLAATHKLITNTIEQNFNVKITDNKVTIPQLDNLALKIPVQLKSSHVNNANLIFTQTSDKTELILKTENQTLKLNHVEVEPNNKQANQSLLNILETSSIINRTGDTITLKSPNLFEIILNVKNNVQDIKSLSFSLDVNNKVTLTYPEKTLDNPVTQIKHEISKQAIPHLAKQFAPQLSFMLAAAISNNKAVNKAEKEHDIFSLLLDAMPDQHKPKLQLSSETNENWKYFTFPYKQDEDELTKHGQMMYSRYQDKNNNEISNLAIKIGFSKIGDVMLKFKILNKNITLNIYTQIDIPDKESQLLSKISSQAMSNSGFLGTVSIKKSKTIDLPLLNSKKIVYSGINIKI
mgnify:CR=1 FL=1